MSRTEFCSNHLILSFRVILIKSLDVENMMGRNQITEFLEYQVKEFILILLSSHSEAVDNIILLSRIVM